MCVKGVAEAELAKEAGRDPIPVSLQIPPKEPDRLRRYQEAGVTRMVFMLRPHDAVDAGAADRKLAEWAERMRALG